jgi:hypothetical protein
MHHVRAMQCFSLKDPEKWPELTMKLPITKLFVQATTILEQFLYQKWSGMESKQYMFSIMHQVRAIMHCFL